MAAHGLTSCHCYGRRVGKVLREHFTIAPVRSEAEGSRIVLEAGFDAAAHKLTGRVVGQPLEGILGIWRNLWEDGHDLASHALMYTKSQLKAAQEVQRQAERSRLPQ